MFSSTKLATAFVSTTQAMSAMLKPSARGDKQSLDCVQSENEPFLDSSERVATKEVDYPSKAPRPHTPGKQDVINSSLEPNNKFFCSQLAHGSATKRIGNFNSIKELYQRIAEEFEEVESPANVMFCTLNSWQIRPTMDNLLGGQLRFDDFIYIHVKSNNKKEVTLQKTEGALGLTITDNGVGIAFIKRIRPDSVAGACDKVAIGDHIQAICGQSTIGWRHFSVARFLRSIPNGHTFSMVLVSPKRSGFESISPRNAKGANESSITSGSQSIRLRGSGTATLQAAPSDTICSATSLIDDELERYVGIRDTALAGDILELWVGSQGDVDKFASDLDDSLGEGIIPDDALFRIDQELRALKLD